MKAAGSTETTVLIVAMRELSRTILSDDGVANAAIAEAGERLQEQIVAITALTDALACMALDRRAAEHSHFTGDGRGPRDVFLNGKLLHDVVFADTKRGIVSVVKRPLQVDKDALARDTLCGVVEVRFKAGCGRPR